jgi:hypothetical protein
MMLLMLAVFTCCVPMAIPMQHVVAYCGDLGFASQYGAAMLSVLLGSAFLARQFWGWLSDRIGGFQTLVCSSLMQATALTGFPADARPDRAVRRLRSLRPRPVGIAAGLCDRDPRLLFGRGGELAHSRRDVRRPDRRGDRGWGAGLLYDFFADYFPAFAIGIGFNLANLGVLLFLVQRRHGRRWRTAAA